MLLNLLQINWCLAKIQTFSEVKWKNFLDYQ